MFLVDPRQFVQRGHDVDERSRLGSPVTKVPRALMRPQQAVARQHVDGLAHVTRATSNSPMSASFEGSRCLRTTSTRDPLAN